MKRAGEQPTGDPRPRRACCTLLVLLAVVFVGNCVADFYRVGYGLNWYMDRQILDATAPTVVAFFRATTSGDIAAATSCMGRGSADGLAERIAQDPAAYQVREVTDFTPIQVYHHHPFVIGAKITLVDGRVKYGRFLVYYDHEPPGWVIGSFNVGDAMPSTPTLH